MGNVEDWNDPEDAEIEQHLERQELSHPVPEPSGNAERAARWIQSPKSMLDSLTDEFNMILSKCHMTLGGSLTIQLKPEFIGVSSFGHFEVVLLVLQLGYTADAVELVNAIQPTPFAAESVRELSETLYQGNSKEFEKSLNQYKRELQKLADWVRAKELLSGTAQASDDAKTQKKKSASEDDVRRAYELLSQSGQTVTKERLGELLRSQGLRIGSTKAHNLKRKIAKQSAVRPPESAD